MPRRIKVGDKTYVVPDDATDDEITQIVDSNGGASEGHVMKAAPSFGSKDWWKELGYNAADKISNVLPAAGGIAGGVVGGAGGSIPGAVGGAALGGAAGESGRQLMRRAVGFKDVPQSSIDAAKNIGIEGVKQGAYEAGGQIIGRGSRALAPKVAEAAVAPGKRLMKSIPENVDIGETILADSKGVRPKTIAKSLDTKIAAHSSAADKALTAAEQKGTTVSLKPARTIVADEATKAAGQNSPSYLRDIDKVREQLVNEHGQTGQVLGTVIPQDVTPTRARLLRQGVDKEIQSWNPELQSNIAPLQRRVYGAITGEIHKSIPDVVAHDQAMTRMIPAKQAAENVAYYPSVTRSAFERLARPTGALVGAGLGAEEGHKYGGNAGAIVGGLTGLIAPNVIASPTGMMIGARTLRTITPIAARALRYGVPIIQGEMKSKNNRPDDSESAEE